MNGYKKIFWGLIFVVFNINLGLINILPDFLGYFLISMGLSAIQNECEHSSFKLAGMIANILGIYNLITSVFTILNGGYEFFGNNVPGMGLTLLVIAANLVMDFNILSGTISIFNNMEKTEEAEETYKIQRKYTYLSIVALFLMSIIFNISSEVIASVIIIYNLIIRIYYIVIIRRIKKFFDNEEILSDTFVQDESFGENNNQEEKL